MNRAIATDISTYIFLSMTPATESKWEDLLRFRTVCRQWKDESDYLIKKAYLADVFDTTDETILARLSSQPLAEFMRRAFFLRSFIKCIYGKIYIVCESLEPFLSLCLPLLYESDIPSFMNHILTSPIFEDLFHGYNGFGITRTVFSPSFWISFLQASFNPSLPTTELLKTIVLSKMYRGNSFAIMAEQYEDVFQKSLFPTQERYQHFNLGETARVLLYYIKMMRSYQGVVPSNPKDVLPASLFSGVVLRLAYDFIHGPTERPYVDYDNVVKMNKLLKKCEPFISMCDKMLYEHVATVFEDWAVEEP